METLIYIADLSVLAIVLYYSYRNDKVTPGDEEEGPFRILIERKQEKNVISRFRKVK